MKPSIIYEKSNAMFNSCRPTGPYTDFGEGCERITQIQGLKTIEKQEGTERESLIRADLSNLIDLELSQQNCHAQGQAKILLERWDK